MPIGLVLPEGEKDDWIVQACSESGLLFLLLTENYNNA